MGSGPQSGFPARCRWQDQPAGVTGASSSPPPPALRATSPAPQGRIPVARRSSSPPDSGGEVARRAGEGEGLKRKASTLNDGLDLILPCKAGEVARKGRRGRNVEDLTGYSFTTPDHPTPCSDCRLPISDCRFFPSSPTPATLYWQLAGGNGTYDRTDQASAVLALARERWRAVPASTGGWSRSQTRREAGRMVRSNTGGAWWSVINPFPRGAKPCVASHTPAVLRRGNAPPCPPKAFPSTRRTAIELRPASRQSAAHESRRL